MTARTDLTLTLASELQDTITVSPDTWSQALKQGLGARGRKGIQPSESGCGFCKNLMGNSGSTCLTVHVSLTMGTKPAVTGAFHSHPTLPNFNSQAQMMQNTAFYSYKTIIRLNNSRYWQKNRIPSWALCYKEKKRLLITARKASSEPRSIKINNGKVDSTRADVPTSFSLPLLWSPSQDAVSS